MVMLEKLMEKMQKMGKDRYVFLFLIGLMCVVIASILETREKKQSEGGGVADDRSSMQESGDNGLRAGAKETGTEGIENLYGDDSSVGGYSMLSYSEYFERHLEGVLSKMEGVGKVCVMITLQSSEELILEKNTPYSRKTDEETKDGLQSRSDEMESDSQVVFYENSDGKEVPVVVRRCAPNVRGIVVLAQGADHPGVSEKISQLLMALFGIDEHKIKVAKYST